MTKNTSESLDRYIVRKYIMAKSALEAIKKDKTAPVNDCWIDEKWQEEKTKQTRIIGFEDKK